MAFGTIGWKGYGVASYCDALADTAGGTWTEDGGGGISYNEDTFLTGSGSIGNVYANKSGYGLYTANTSFDFTSDSSGTGTVKVPNQLFYIWVYLGSDTSLETLANDGLSIFLGSDTSNNRHFKIAGSDDSNEWGSGWKLFTIDPLSAGSLDNGTYDAGNISVWGLWMDVTASVRADSIFIDQIAIAEGVEAHSGSGTLADIITYCYGELVSRVVGSYTYKGRFNYVLGKTFVGNSSDATADTILTATSQINGYNVSEYWNGTAWVASSPIDSNNVVLEKHASYDTSYLGINTSMFGNSNGLLYFSKDSGITFDYDGGTFENLSTVAHDSDWSMQNCILSRCASRTITGGVFDDNKISESDPLIIDGSTTYRNDVKDHLSNGATCVSPSDLSSINGWYFKRDANGYGVDIGNITTTISLDWKNTESGYTTGTAGTDVGVTPTGAETILCNVSNGEVLTISVESGASTPSVANSGLGTVNVVAGLLPISISVKNAQTGLGIPDANVMILRDDTKATIISGTTNGDGDYAESVASTYNGVNFIGWARQMDLSGIDYVQKDFSGTISSTGVDIQVSLEPR